jgi:hypothetical protein
VWELPPQSARRRRRRVGLGALAALGVVVLVAAIVYVVHGLWPTIRVSNATKQELPTIQAMPEAALLVPGSHIFARTGSPASVLGGGAAVFTVAGSNESKQDIFKFLTQQLAERGWQGPSSHDLNAAVSWARGRYNFTLAFLGDPGDPSYSGQSQYATTYAVGVKYSRQ